MASRDDHLTQARHNTEFYESFDRSKYSDWAAVVLFYIAIHYIDAFLATRKIHPTSHDIRDNYVARISELRPIAYAYFALKNSSVTARYYPPVRYPMGHIQELEKVHLERIRTELRQYLPI